MARRTPAVLGIDVGTSSTKGVLAALDGRILRSAQREHAADRPGVGLFEMDPETWWAEFVSIARELVAPGDAEVVAIGPSGMGPCLVLADGDGRPVRPAILYGVDTRAGAQIAEITERLGEQHVLETCGSPLTSQSLGPKIAWVHEMEPEAYARARMLLGVPSLLVHRLTGEYVMDHQSAALAAPLYDARRRTWHEEWARGVSPGLRLPALHDPGEIAGRVSARAARELPGIPAGTPVVAGSIDAWCEAVSVDATAPGDLMVMYGTTLFLIATTSERHTSRDLSSTPGIDPGTWALAGGMATSGAITAWLRELTGGATFPELMTEAGRSGPGARGLLMLPYFAGERTPLQDPEARGTVLGLTLGHTRGDLYRAALEASAFAARHILEVLATSGAASRRAVAVGGGAQGGLWPQILSDVTGLVQTVPERTVGAPLGAAMLAARLHGPIDAADWNPTTDTRRPDPALREVYGEMYGLYREAYPATAGIAHALARIQARENRS